MTGTVRDYEQELKDLHRELAELNADHIDLLKQRAAEMAIEAAFTEAEGRPNLSWLRMVEKEAMRGYEGADDPLQQFLREFRRIAPLVRPDEGVHASLGAALDELGVTTTQKLGELMRTLTLGALLAAAHSELGMGQTGGNEVLLSVLSDVSILVEAPSILVRNG